VPKQTNTKRAVLPTGLVKNFNGTGLVVKLFTSKEGWWYTKKIKLRVELQGNWQAICEWGNKLGGGVTPKPRGKGSAQGYIQINLRTTFLKGGEATLRDMEGDCMCSVNFQVRRMESVGGGTEKMGNV